MIRFSNCNDLSWSVMLIALGLGYIVCYLANREEKNLRYIGLAVGTLIMTIATLILLSSIAANYVQLNYKMIRATTMPHMGVPNPDALPRR